MLLIEELEDGTVLRGVEKLSMGFCTWLEVGLECEQTK